MKTAEEYQSGELAAAMNDAQQIEVIRAIQLDALQESARIALARYYDPNYNGMYRQAGREISEAILDHAETLTAQKDKQ